MGLQVIMTKILYSIFFCIRNISKQCQIAETYKRVSQHYVLFAYVKTVNLQDVSFMERKLNFKCFLEQCRIALLLELTEIALYKTPALQRFSNHRMHYCSKDIIQVYNFIQVEFNIYPFPVVGWKRFHLEIPHQYLS